MPLRSFLHRYTHASVSFQQACFIYIKIHVMSVDPSFFFFLIHFSWNNLIAKYIYGFLLTRQIYSDHFKVNM